MLTECLRFAVLTVGCLALGACSFQYHHLSGGEVQQSQQHWWPPPKYGRYLCLSVEPGTPVYGSAEVGGLIGYTRNVVAFAGLQEGPDLEIVYYNGLLGWIDGTKIRPYHGPHPGSTCIIPGVDMQQRPIFVIR